MEMLQNNICVYNLRTLIHIVPEDALTNLLNSFSSPQNPDVEHFLKTNSVDFTNKSQSVTYLVFSSENEDLLGYFSLAIKPVSIQIDVLSKSQLKKLRRVSNIDETSSSITLSAYLIAQLGKNYSIPKEKRIDGTKLLNMAYDKIVSLKHDVGGIAAFLECEENDFLLDFYTRNNHFEFGTRETKDTGKNKNVILHQFLKFL